jgi:hypothetical protein
MPRKSPPSKVVRAPSIVSPTVPPAVPGILTQIATNATGTAIGHVVAHQIIGTPSGSTIKPCAKEIDALLLCGKENGDLNFCADFLEKLRLCN